MNERPDAAGWSPEQYLRFVDQRMRPALELLERGALAAPRLVVDLGCGTGSMTRIMAARWPAARIVSVDQSREMLDRARADLGDVAWVEADIAGWRPDAPPDLIYSNAALHWIDGHETLFPRLAGFVAPGGFLAVQMPLSWDLPSHRLMRETLANGGDDGAPLGEEALRATVGRKPVSDAAFYHDLLAPRAAHLDLWETEYHQVLEGDDPVLEWVKGTGLRPVLHGLAGEAYERFLAEYGRRLRVAYPRRSDGTTLYPFRRLFIVAGIEAAWS